ncbi:MAG: anhydro-N-acetylmuramic acid kinase [Planctomycetota bacterium]|nr:anhydro-N-acetylmuramic acid kinase [Planctomycetota bacterium]
MRGRRKFIGLMSGTSCDGVDAALVEIDGSGLDMRVEFIAHRHVEYAEPFRNALLAVMAPAKTRTEDLAGLNVQLGEEFATCARQLMEQADVRADQLAAIGSHGQTICHMPDGDDHHPRCTYQIGESAIIAAQTGATVVADFRAADLAVGGQGAPLVPWTDYVLFRSDDQARIVQNIGGIANLTYLPTGRGAEDTIAFDTGPGCMVIDTIIRRLTQRKHRYDPQGLYASRGEPDMSCVEKMMQLPFFRQPPPKSAGREQFGRSFVSGMRQLVSGRGLDKYDMLATGTMLTARSIAYAYKTHLGIDLDDVEVILYGGGAHNKTLVSMLQAELPETEFKTVEDFAIPLQAKECVSFAMLAAACIDGVPANLPQVTGASRPVILGKVVRV